MKKFIIAIIVIIVTLSCVMGASSKEYEFTHKDIVERYCELTDMELVSYVGYSFNLYGETQSTVSYYAIDNNIGRELLYVVDANEVCETVCLDLGIHADQMIIVDEEF